jgi:arsenate reductase
LLIYGLSTCPVCSRAQKDLEAAGIQTTFRDVRADPLSETELGTLLAEFGDRLVDRTTNDYRALSDWLKNSEADAQIMAKPKVMARPVLSDGDTLYLGWDDTVRAKLLP